MRFISFLPSFCHVQDEHGKNEKNNVTSRYAVQLQIAKRSTTSQQHYNKFHATLALIPVLNDPDGIQAVARRHLDSSKRHRDGSKQLLVGPKLCADMQTLDVGCETCKMIPVQSH